MSRSRVLVAMLVLSTAVHAADAPVAPPAATTTVQKLDGDIDTSSRRVLLPDDPVPGDALVIATGSERQTHECAERTVQIEGDYRIVELTGTCPLLRIRGNFNVVRVAATEQIDIIGDENAVTWNRVPNDPTGRKKPLLTTRGARNMVAPGD